MIKLLNILFVVFTAWNFPSGSLINLQKDKKRLDSYSKNSLYLVYVR